MIIYIINEETMEYILNLLIFTLVFCSLFFLILLFYAGIIILFSSIFTTRFNKVVTVGIQINTNSYKVHDVKSVTQYSNKIILVGYSKETNWEYKKVFVASNFKNITWFII